LHYRAGKGCSRLHQSRGSGNDEEDAAQQRFEDPYEKMLSKPGLQDLDNTNSIFLRKAAGSRARRVPLDQQPFNELSLLKEAPLYNWPQKDMQGYAGRLAAVYAVSAVVSLPIASVTFPKYEQLLQVLLSANIGALGVLAVLVLRLWAGWDYISQRLDEVYFLNIQCLVYSVSKVPCK
jgi:Conserved in the green lineage and diatoms 27